MMERVLGRGFALLWAGQSVSQLGSQVTLVALPLTAILLLGASSTQVGLLFAAGYLPAAAFGLFAGVWVDRVRRRPLLIACQITLGATTITIPLAAWFNVLHLEHLFVLQAINGALNVLSTSSSQAFLPALVRTEQLPRANARLSTSDAVARVAGPSFAGVVVQVLSAPAAMLADAISFFFCAGCIALVKQPEAAPRQAAKRNVRQDIQEGLYLVLKHRLLRPMALAMGGYNFFAAMFTGVYTLFMVRELQLSPAMVGVIFACGGVGGVLGALIAVRVRGRFGAGRAVVGSALLLAFMHLTAPIAGGPVLVAAALLATGGILAQMGASVLQVSRTSLIQQLVPAHTLGRVSATQSVIVLTLVPLGAALGGLIGDSLGLRAAVGIGAVGTIVATASMLRSPLWSSPGDDADAVVVDAVERAPRETSAYKPLAKRFGLHGTVAWARASRR